VSQIGKQGLIELLEPTLRSLGYELVDLDSHAGPNGLLRLYIDSDAGITLSDCEFVSAQIGAFLDVEDPLPGSYSLEVSSPGLDRRLRTAAHFERFAGERAKVSLKRALDGRRRMTGTIGPVEDGSVVIDVDGEAVRLELSEIAEARLAPSLGKPGNFKNSRKPRKPRNPSTEKSQH
jgi:ribosome maturation factor RimP